MSIQNLSRRDFLKITGTGLAGAAFSGLLGGCSSASGSAKDSSSVPETKAPETSASLSETVSAEVPAVKYEADAVVVGGGAAGLMAAYKLSKEGKSVIIMEKGPNSACSNFANVSGPMAADTSIMKDLGVELATADKIYTYITDFAKSSCNHLLIKNLLKSSPEAIESLLSLGLHMYTYMDVMQDPSYKDVRTWASVHIFEEYGPDRVQPIVDAIEAAGGQFLYNCEGRDLRMEDGAVAGVDGLQDEVPVEVHAPAVFLSTGGYGANTEMFRQYFGDLTRCYLGTPLNTGDGTQMAVRAGASMDRNFTLIANEMCGSSLKHGSGVMWDENFCLTNDNLAFFNYGGLMVNPEGRRFADEGHLAKEPLVYHGQLAGMSDLMYFILDSRYYDGVGEKGIYEYLGSPESWPEAADLMAPFCANAKDQLEEAIQEGWAYKADTLAELAEHFGLSHLEETVARYNELCEAGEDLDFHKDSCFLQEVKEGPFYAFEYNLSYFSAIGGIRTDGQLRALTPNREVIPGLYVGGLEMGSAFGNAYYDYKGAACGLSLASGILGATGMIEYLDSL